MRRAAALSLLACLLASATPASSTPVAHADHTFYVSPAGDDRWSGRLHVAIPSRADGPFATLARAQVAVRQVLRQPGGKRVRVVVRGGRYYLVAPLALGEADSGTRRDPVVWCAFPGERPVLSGGRRIVRWEPYGRGILQADLAEAGPGAPSPHDLFLDGVRQVRARTPNLDRADPLYGGLAFMEAPAGPDAFRYPPGLLPRPLRNAAQAMVTMFVGPNGGWGSQSLPVTGVDYKRHVIHTRYRDGEDRLLGFNSNCRFVVENDLALLDQPGEWCVDAAADKLYFQPPTPLTDRSQVVVPVLPTLLRLHGARWITVSGLTFTETTAEGRASVDCEDSEGIALVRNRFLAAGWRALAILGGKRGCAGVLVRRNEVAYAGSSGIYVAGQVRDCILADNDLHHCGVYDKYSAGIEFPFYGGTAGEVSPAAFTDNVVIAHNHVHDLPRDGIQLGANPWGRNVVEFNRVERTALETVDAGAIRSHRVISHLTGVGHLPSMRGHVIRGNVVADTCGCGVRDGRIVTPYPWPTFGIYLDEGSSNCLVTGNLVLRSGVGLIINPGERNVIEGNVFAGNVVGLYYQAPTPFDTLTRPLGDNHFARNIVYLTDHEARVWTIHDGGHDTVRMSGPNLAWNTARTAAVDVKDREWRLANPGFVDPSRGDYRLKRGSPALALGIASLDVRAAGIRPGWRR